MLPRGELVAARGLEDAALGPQRREGVAERGHPHAADVAELAESERRGRLCEGPPAGPLRLREGHGGRGGLACHRGPPEERVHPGRPAGMDNGAEPA